MKVKFSRSVPYTPKWRDNDALPVNEQVKCYLRPLKVDDLFNLMDLVGGDTSKIDNKRMQVMIKEAGHLVETNVDLSGLEDEDGEVDQFGIVQYPVYLELAVEILMKLAEISMPTEADVKN